MPCPLTGSRSHPPRHQSLWIPQLLGNEATAGAIGLSQRYVCSGPWHRAFKTHSHHLGGKSITHPNPEGRVTAGENQQLVANTTRVHGGHRIPAWGQLTPCSYGHPSRFSQGTGPHMGSGVTLFSARLFQDAVSGAMYINMMTCSRSLVGLGVTPLVGDHSMPTFLGEEDMDSN